jgi:hypothetical protein
VNYVPVGGNTVAIARVLTHRRIKDAVRYDLASDFEGSEKLANDECSGVENDLLTSASERGLRYGSITKV